MWAASGLIYSGSYTEAVDTSIPMENTLDALEDASIRTTTNKGENKIALTQIREGNIEVENLTWCELRRRVGLLSNSLRARGVGKGDRVAVIASNSFDTFITFMAITSLGGLFSSSSTDMGTKGILERLLQIKPNTSS
ncbi:Acs Acyl-coenzyme A synthetase-AMP- acid ligase [Pyrenophora tritici-repentis]|nr:Acs Acyl-coenzyme A synthetase-AMP- acid ligase [Pyrenophora tritici-repentis]